MSIFLVQHGKSLPKDLDPEKGLSNEGKTEVEQIAVTARDKGLAVTAIRHSGKKRARETADILAEALNPIEGAQETAGLGPLDDVTRMDVSRNEAVMFVGHLPFMENLTSYLVTGSFDRPPVLKFQNGGIVCLERVPDSDAWCTKWTLFPHIRQS